MKKEKPTPTVFDKVSTYWAEIANANATEKQVAFVKSQLQTEGSESLVLDLACGNGRHAIALCKAGYKIIGLDASSKLLKIAKTKTAGRSGALTLVCGDMRFLPFHSGVFSAVLSLDSSFGYLPSETEDLQSFSEVARILRGNGLFLVDVFNREHVMKRYGKKATTVKRVYPSFLFTLKRRANSETGVMRDIWIFRDRKTGKATRTQHVIRLYSCSQLQKLLKNSGFCSFKIFGGYEKQSYVTDSSRLLVVSRKV